MTDPAKFKTRWHLLRPPYLLVWKDKHCTNYYLITGTQELLRVSLEILKERRKNGYLPTVEEEERAVASLEANLVALKSVKASARAEELLAMSGRIGHATAELNREKDELLQAKAVSAALKLRLGQEAFRILMARRDYEYEETHVESFNNRL